MRALARGGYLATGIIHAIIGCIAFALVLSRRPGEADQIGALAAIAGAPLGMAALWLLALLLFALGAFHGAHGFALQAEPRMRRWGRRAAEWGQGIAFLVMGGIATSVAFGARPDPDESAQDASRGLLSADGGPVLLALIGAGICAAGIVWIVMGVRRSFRQRMSLPDGGAGHAIAAVGVFGFVAKGAALATVGALLLIAALRRDPDTAGGLDAAVERLRALPFGEAIVVAVGVGFVAYGVFCFLRARYAEL